MQCEMRFDKWFYSHKFNGNGVRYEMECVLQLGTSFGLVDLFRCEANNPTDSHEGGLLRGVLDKGEMVEADCGYERRKWYIKIPTGSHNRYTRGGGDEITSFGLPHNYQWRLEKLQGVDSRIPAGFGFPLFLL